MEIVAVPPPQGTGGDDIGVVIDRPSRTMTAVMAVRGHNFALLSGADQDSRIAAWARVLSTLAREGSEIHRVQWVESCTPDDGSAVREYVDAHAVLDQDASAGRSYRELVAESSPITRRHEVLIGLSLHTARSARAIRAVAAAPPARARCSPASSGPASIGPSKARTSASTACSARPLSGVLATRTTGRPTVREPRSDRAGRGRWRSYRCGRWFTSTRPGTRPLDRRVAPGRRRPRLPRPVPVRAAPADVLGGHGAGPPAGRPPGGPGADRGLADHELRRRDGFSPRPATPRAARASTTATASWPTGTRSCASPAT